MRALQEETYESRVDLGLWRKLLRYALRYPWHVAGLCVLAITTAGADTAFPLVTRAVIDAIGEDPQGFDPMPFVWAYAVVTTVLCASVYGFIGLAGWLRTHVSHDIREAGFANLQRLSFSYFDHRPVGWLMARMTSDCERLSNIMAWGTLDIVWGFTTMTATVSVMLWFSPLLALITLSVIPVLLWISVVFQRRILQSSRVVRKANSRLTAAYNECIAGVRTAKIYTREAEDQREFDGLATEMYGASVRNRLQSALYTPLVITLASLATGAALAAGGAWTVAGGLSLGTLVLFVTYSRLFFEPVTEISRVWAELQMAHASAERILGLIEAVPDVRDSLQVRYTLRFADETPRDEGVAPDGFPDRIGDVDFRGVNFHYVEDEPVLRDFDLHVPEGRTVALVGSTGGGKSTIVNLLCRFYEPTSGEIRLGDVEYRERGLHWLQSKLGIVLQTPHLFSGTIADNIRYGRLDATDDEIVEAARVAGAHDFVERLEEGYATQVGEGGARLSVGEKQLVSFARAVLADPELLVMDEATSSIDTETERRIQRGLERVLAGRTAFVIAHRLSTIRRADLILVIEGGRIVERGRHAELLALGGRYHDLYTRQSEREADRTLEAWGDDAAPATS